MCTQCSSTFVKITQQFDEHLYLGSSNVINNLLDDFLNVNSIRGCALGIIRNNEIVYLSGRGNTNGGDPIELGNPSCIGSISKTITALGIFVLAEEGYLKLNDEINNLLPIPDPSLDNIRVIDLLSHKSGISNHNPNFTGVHPAYLLPGIELPFPKDEADLTNISDLPHPGIHPRIAYYTYYRGNCFSDTAASEGKYSNVNFLLLGAIIDKITNDDYSGPKGYSAFIWQKVLAKAGITTPCLAAKWRNIYNLANGYKKNNSLQSWPSSLWGWEGPVGGWTMTIGDLTRLIVAINTDKIISSSFREQMMTNSSNNDSFFPPKSGFGLHNWYGLGIQLFSEGNINGYMHHGDSYGYTARITHFDDSNIGVALMFNKSDVEKLNIWELTRQIRHAVLFGALNNIQLTAVEKEKQDNELYKFCQTYKESIVNFSNALQLFEKINPNFDIADFIIKANGRKGKKLITLFKGEKYEQAAIVASEIIKANQERHLSIHKNESEELPNDIV